jgi:hypothetical protein
MLRKFFENFGCSPCKKSVRFLNISLFIYGDKLCINVNFVKKNSKNLNKQADIQYIVEKIQNMEKTVSRIENPN